MNKEQIIEGLRFTKEMFLLDPITNETMTKEQLNDMSRTTVDACEGAIEILQAIPQEHDGCKDCRWQSQSETEMPCKQCKHNYTDEWERAKIGHWVETGRMFVEPNDDQILYEYICDSCKGLAYFRKSMDDLVGAKYCPCCNSHMEIEK